MQPGPKSGRRGELDFAAKLCLTLGHKSLAETMSLPAAEFAFWADYHARHGFPLDRLSWGVAIAGAAVCRSNGAKKVEPKDLLPRSGGRSRASVAAAFAAIPGARVERVPKGGGPRE